MFEGDRHRKKNERMRVQNLIQFKQRERRKRCDELNRESDFKLTEKGRITTKSSETDSRE